MIQSKKDYFDYLKADRISLGQKRRHPHLISIWESDIIWKYQILLRKNEYYHNCYILKRRGGVKYTYYKIIQYRLFRFQVKYGLNIPINVFGPGLSIAHLGPIVINGFASVGNNCRLHPFTTIGIDGRSGKVAVIGDDVYLGNGCKLIGDVRIGDGIVIAAGAVVTKSCNEENAVLGGIPAKIISYSGNPLPKERRGANYI